MNETSSKVFEQTVPFSFVELQSEDAWMHPNHDALDALRPTVVWPESTTVKRQHV